jgi:hypothetical protein
MSYWNQAILEGFSATDRKTIILAFQHMRTRALALDIKQCVAEIYST